MDPNAEIVNTIPDVQWGESAYQELLGLTVRHPASHRSNILHLLDSIHSGSATDDWVNRKVSLSHEEFIRLGNKLKQAPVISIVELSKPDFVALAVQEPRRAKLAQVFDGSNSDAVQQLDFIDSLELRLFTDGQELTVGWEKKTEGGERQGWAIRTATLTLGKRENVQRALTQYQELVPETRIIQNGSDTILLSRFVSGTFATADDIVLFRQELARKGIAEDKFDLNRQNVIRTQEGRLVYVDGDYLDP